MVSSSRDKSDSPSMAPESANMVERVWEAINEALHLHGNSDIHAGLAWLSREGEAAVAIAAIEAMREPTDAMIRSGGLYELSVDHGPTHTVDLGDVAAGNIYRVMIDAEIEKPAR